MCNSLDWLYVLISEDVVESDRLNSGHQALKAAKRPFTVVSYA